MPKSFRFLKLVAQTFPEQGKKVFKIDEKFFKS